MTRVAATADKSVDDDAQKNVNGTVKASVSVNLAEKASRVTPTSFTLQKDQAIQALPYQTHDEYVQTFPVEHLVHGHQVPSPGSSCS